MAERACVAEGRGELHGWIRGCMHGWRQCACLPPSTPRTVGKWVVCILLECCLVYQVFVDPFYNIFTLSFLVV